MNVRVDVAQAKPGKSDLTFVDCDVHPMVPLKHITSRMSARALRNTRFSGHESGTSREHNRNLHPSGPLRPDAIPPGGGIPGSDPAFVITDWLDRHNVAAAVLMPIQGTAVVPWGSHESVDEFVRALNDCLFEMWQPLDKRFRPTITINPHDMDSAVEEIERNAGRPGAVGINVPLADINPGSRAFYKVYAAAAHHKLPVVFHPTGAEGNLSDAPDFAGGVVRTYPEHHALLAQSGQAAAAAIVLGGALARFPDLRIVFAEFAFSWVAPLCWRMDTIWKRNGGPDGILNKPPSEYVYEQMRFTTQPYDEPENARDLWPLLDAMKADKTLLFSSDYPHWDTDDPTIVLRNRLPPHLRERVAMQTAIETFGDRLFG